MAVDTQPNTSMDLVDFSPYEVADDEPYMSDAQLQHFQTIITTIKQRLMEDVDGTLKHLQENPGQFADPIDRAVLEEEFTRSLRARDRERKLIRKLENTLTLISNKDYGFCESCGAEIGIRRLEVRPTATYCIDCKTLEEIREKQTEL